MNYTKIIENLQPLQIPFKIELHKKLSLRDFED